MLFFLLFYIPELYTAGLLIYLFVQVLRKKKLPMRLLLINVVCLGVLFWLKYKVENHEIVFAGGYQRADDWGQGLSNLVVSVQNMAIFLLLFFAVQIPFIVLFKKKFKEINLPVEQRPADSTDLF